MSPSPNLQNLFKSPEASIKRKSVGSPAVPGVTGVTSPTIQKQVLAGVSSLGIQQQIMNVINSGTAPKDQPYYIIVNQGTPSEQTFLIEPNKHTGKHLNLYFNLFILAVSCPFWRILLKTVSNLLGRIVH